jgi:hypothetical protein
MGCFNPHAYARRDWQLYDVVSSWIEAYIFANPKIYFILIENLLQKMVNLFLASDLRISHKNDDHLGFAFILLIQSFSLDYSIAS